MVDVGQAIELLQPGSHVEVVCRFTGTWVGGFQVAAVEHDGWVIRRTADREVLPVRFPAAMVRQDRLSVPDAQVEPSVRRGITTWSAIAETSG
jgi:hypothetical protein